MSPVPLVLEYVLVDPGDVEPLLYLQSGPQGWIQGRWPLGVVPVEKTPSPGLGIEEMTDEREGQAQVKEIIREHIPRL